MTEKAAFKKDPMSPTGLMQAGSFHIWQMPGGHGKVIDAARPPLSPKGIARSIRMPATQDQDTVASFQIPGFLPRRPLYPHVNPRALERGLLVPKGLQKTGGDLSEEQKQLLAEGHGTRIYSCGHEERCRCHADTLQQTLDTPCYECLNQHKDKSASSINVYRNSPAEDSHPQHINSLVTKVAADAVAALDRELEKQSSTALVRNIAKGLLSPATIQRAAKAMPMGAVRQVKPALGKATTFRLPQLPTNLPHGATGNFNVAHTMVGHWPTHAGLAVRKLPLRDIGDPAQHYGQLPQYVNSVNKFLQHHAGVKGNAIAPVIEAGHRGLYQMPATEIVPGPLQRLAASTLDDVYHPLTVRAQAAGLPQGHNMSPTGQVFDFAVSPDKFNTLAGENAPIVRRLLSRAYNFLTRAPKNPAKLQSPPALDLAWKTDRLPYHQDTLPGFWLGRNRANLPRLADDAPERQVGRLIDRHMAGPQGNNLRTDTYVPRQDAKPGVSTLIERALGRVHENLNQ